MDCFFHVITCIYLLVCLNSHVIKKEAIPVISDSKLQHVITGLRHYINQVRQLC